ncbi:MAG: tetratricopeptide repeat protein [Magnetococcales bacterium]|nr:tetratricopeptide repeat protein [Magnetococcales bacterium]
MTWIWILPSILIATLLGVFYPIFTRRGGDPLPVGLEGDPREELTAQRDGLLLQIKELELEGHGDAISAESRSSLERELGALLIRLDALHQAPKGKSTAPLPLPATPKGPLDVAMAVSSMLFIGMFASGLYLLMGTPAPIAPASHSKQQAVPHEIATMVEQAAQRLKSKPDDIEGWTRLARSYQVMNRPGDAMAAYAHILTRQPDNLEAIVSLSELQLQQTDPQRHAEAIHRLESLLAKQPDHPEALWLLGSAAFRLGERTKALAYWNRLKPLLPPGSEASKTVQQAIQEASAP